MRFKKKVESDFNKLFDKVVKEDFPFLGACSGCGLLGNYCNANISRKFTEAVGGIDILVTEDGKEDPLLQGLSDSFRALVGHKEACDFVPKDAILLATGDNCPVQMFRIGSNVYATQFHPEADAKEFILRVNVYKNNGYFKPEEYQRLIGTLEKEKITQPQKILWNFVETHRK